MGRHLGGCEGLGRPRAAIGGIWKASGRHLGSIHLRFSPLVWGQTVQKIIENTRRHNNNKHKQPINNLNLGPHFSTMLDNI